MAFCLDGLFSGGCLQQTFFVVEFLHDILSPSGFLSKRVSARSIFHRVAKVRVAFVGWLKSVTRFKFYLRIKCTYVVNFNKVLFTKIFLL